jgi:hypothetical protein
MSGKNQQKRIAKNLAHVEMVWEREQIQAAKAKASLDEALATIRKNSAELDDEKMATIETHAARRYKEIEEFIMSARDKYVAKMKKLNPDFQ